jgi:hypothetical protein
VKIKDIRTEIKNWYVIQGDEHLKMGSFKDAVELMDIRAHNHPGQQLIMMSDKEYSTYKNRKTKRGKKS